MTLVAELHDFLRFESPRHLMAYLGLVPDDPSSGSRLRQGAITKADEDHDGGGARVVRVRVGHRARGAAIGLAGLKPVHAATAATTVA